MTIDKYIAIKWLHKAATYSTPKRAKMIAVGLAVGAFVYNIPHLFLSSFMGDLCVAYGIEFNNKSVFMVQFCSQCNHPIYIFNLHEFCYC